MKPIEDWVRDLVDETATAFEQFGSYTFYDKGASEVVDIDHYAEELKALSGKAAGRYLEALSKGPHEGAACVAQAILEQCDGEDGQWWDACRAAAPSVAY